MGKRIWITVGVVLAVLALAGGLLWALWPPADPPAPLDPDPIALDVGHIRYVALGDSYSAGEGLPPFSVDTVDVERGGDRCHRSALAYPNRLIFVPAATVEHRACSGGEIEDLYEAIQEHGGRPVSLGRQAEGVLDSSVGLITLTIGGNDAHFADVVAFCSTHRSCIDDPYLESDSLEEWAELALSDVASRLPALYGRLRDEAGDEARIVVLGYPKLFSQDPTSRGLCVVYQALFSDQEREQLNNLTLRLNRVIEESAQASGIEYVDLSYIFAGRETCASAGAWLRFARLDNRQYGNFHPTANGQAMIARTIACYLTIVDDVPEPEEQVEPDVSVPSDSVGSEELQHPTTDGPTGDLGDDLYDCATGVRTDEAELDPTSPPVASLKPYADDEGSAAPSSRD